MKISFILLFTSIFAFSQKESGNKSIAFPKIENNLEIKPIPKTPKSSEYSINEPFNPPLFKVPTKKYDAPKIEKPMEITPEISDLKPGLIFEKKLNKVFNEGDLPDTRMFRTNQFAGEIKTKTNQVGIFYKDFGLVDGDIIRVYLNDAIVINEITLTGSFSELKIPLKEGFNKIEFESLYEGSSYPNTAEYKVYDANSNLVLSNQWFLANGFKAYFIVVKE